jgi:hypothetical protein
VLCVAGTAKLRDSKPARRALLALGLPSGRAIVPAIGLCELAIGGWGAIAPSRAGAVAIAVIYAGFALIAAALARRQVSCGCFGGDDRPASMAQAILSAAIALVALGAALAGPHGLTWALGRPLAQSAVLLIGAAAATWAAVLAYTEFPAAWGAWSAR